MTLCPIPWHSKKKAVAMQQGCAKELVRSGVPVLVLLGGERG